MTQNAMVSVESSATLKRKLDNWISENFVYIFEAKDLPSTTDDVMLDRVPSGQSSALS